MSYTYNLGLRFYSVAETQGSRIAVRFTDGKEYSYTEINELSNQTAHYLLKRGIKKGKVVAILNEKSVHAYCVMLACLKIGAIYTNLDASSPFARIQKILQTCQPSLLVCDRANNISEEIGAHFTSLPQEHLAGSPYHTALSKQPKSNLSETRHVKGNDPAYIMFTSGSTGFPKGAVMSHSNVLHFIDWGRTTFDVTTEDIFTNVNPIYFDNSVFDFYVSLFNGAALVPISHDLAKNARELVKAINQSKCTIWFSVPSLLVYLLTTKALGADDFSTIKRISFGGEGFPKNKLQQLFKLYGNRIKLFNVYGPTECTCICSSYIISEKDFENMNELAPLGFMAPNFGYEILAVDETKPGFGELALTGPCVGLGYYNDAERTSKAFVQNPNAKYMQVMYKTGDLVEKSENGYLHFRGRIDNQVKHMGYRIELEEVEAAFSTLGYINEVGVIYEKISAELGQIVAYVSVSDKQKDTKEILDDVRKILPPYMMPRIVNILDVLPKNQNGKIDRKQLRSA